MRRDPLLALALWLCLVGTIALSHGSAASAHPPGATASVVGGAPSAPGTYPWMAALLFRGSFDESDFVTFEKASGSVSRNPYDDFFCGGSLIAPDRILTAGHCVIGMAPSSVVVRIGDGDLVKSPHLQVHVKRIATHPGFKEPRSFEAPTSDVAILELAQPVNVPPLPLIDAAQAAQLPPGTLVRAIGRGLTDPKGNGDASPIVRETDMSLIGDTRCEQASPSKFHPFTQLCVGDAPGRGVCYGDSGSPLLVNSGAGWMELGVASSLLDLRGSCVTDRFPQVFSRLSTLGEFALSPDPTYAPYNLRRPAIRGHLKIGATLRCRRGRWHGEHGRFQYTWLGLRFANRLGNRPRLRVTRRVADAGAICIVETANRGGYDAAASAPLRKPRKG